VDFQQKIISGFAVHSLIVKQDGVGEVMWAHHYNFTPYVLISFPDLTQPILQLKAQKSMGKQLR
jgi:hypothetical protein